MDIMAITLTLSMFTGICFLMIGGFFIKPRNDKSNDVIFDKSMYDNEINDANIKVKKSVEEVDDAILQLNNMSGLIMDEMQGKYKELLFLYQMIEDKKNDFLKLTPASTNSDSQSKSIPKEEINEPDSNDNLTVDTDNNPTEEPEANLPSHENEKFSQVISLYDSGLSITEIGKKMGIGKGEVQFIIEIYKGRQHYG